jgi:DHA1 family bicyclomycin/chloramphenicol resistance-like MFS transporter
MTNVGAIADELADAYSTSLLMIGAFTAALFLGHSASQIPAGHVIDRVGPRAPALAAVALTIVAGLGALLAPAPALALAARVVAGVAAAAVADAPRRSCDDGAATAAAGCGRVAAASAAPRPGRFVETIASRRACSL